MLRAVSFADNVPQSDSLRQCRIAYVIASWSYFYFVLIFLQEVDQERLDLYEKSLVAQTIAAFSAASESIATKTAKPQVASKYQASESTSDIPDESLSAEILEGRTNRDVVGCWTLIKLCLFVSHFYLKADRWPAKIIVLSSQKDQPLTAKNFPFMTIK